MISENWFALSKKSVDELRPWIENNADGHVLKVRYSVVIFFFFFIKSGSLDNAVA